MDLLAVHAAPSKGQREILRRLIDCTYGPFIPRRVPENRYLFSAKLLNALLRA